MRYDDQDRESSNVEDRRGQSDGGGGMFGGGGGGGIPIPIGRGGFSFTTMIIIGVLMLLFGLNPLDLITGGSGAPDMSRVPQMPRMDQGNPKSGRNPFEIPGLPGAPGKAQNAGQDELGRFTRRV